ncbi:MAG TPA: class I SAM-dependent methyltransferase [Spirochaetota bacterium]
MKSSNQWDIHYTRQKSALGYPDENLVRMIKPFLENCDSPDTLRLFDCGCGSGRHLSLASELGLQHVVGGDIAYNGLSIADKLGFPLIQCDSRALPFHNETFDIIICWGSLHYGPKVDIPLHLAEFRRVLKKNGVIFGTLRSTRDTMLRKGKNLGNDEWITDLSDIKSSFVSFYSEEELKKYFSSFSLHYGLIERTPIDNITSTISHWYFRADV